MRLNSLQRIKTAHRCRWCDTGRGRAKALRPNASPEKGHRTHYIWPGRLGQPPCPTQPGRGSVHCTMVDRKTPAPRGMLRWMMHPGEGSREQLPCAQQPPTVGPELRALRAIPGWITGAPIATVQSPIGQEDDREHADFLAGKGTNRKSCQEIPNLYYLSPTPPTVS